jgi:hypothetical protein
MNYEVTELHPEFKDSTETQICLEHWSRKVLVTHKSGEKCPLCAAEARLEELEVSLEEETQAKLRVMAQLADVLTEKKNDE